MDAIETQNETIEAWRMTMNQVTELDEKKGVLSDMVDLGALWSEFCSRVNDLDRAIEKLRKY